ADLDLLGERPLDGRALRADLLDVPGVDLIEEERAVGDALARRRLAGHRADVQVDRQQDEREDDPRPAEAEAGRRRGRCRPARRGRRRRAVLARGLGISAGHGLWTLLPATIAD